ncbi:tyrosine-type recombinase/integrase [Streptomyces sp. NPDC048483]|uniref:tyrosine-type recombinase/integrase n=1 Tax=Streptomyces sp. NPDC048483 TaxID=3154927 RepID=UPI00342C4616
MSERPYDRWHKKHPKSDDEPCRCGSKKHPLYPSADHGRGMWWRAQYVDPHGQTRRPTFAHWDEAMQKLAEARTDLRRGTWTDPDIGIEPAAALARAWVEEWVPRKYKNKNTRNTYTSHMDTHLIPFLERRRPLRVRDLRRRDSNALVDALAEAVESRTYLKQIFKTWRIWINWLIDERDVPLPANVVSRVALPPASKRKPAKIAPEDVARIAACIDPRLEVTVWMAACGGLREGEVFGMTRDRVDFLRKRWYVEEQRQEGQAVETKTKASMTWISIDDFLVEKIAAHLAAGYDKSAPVAAASEARRLRRGYVAPPEEGLIIVNAQGRALRRQMFNDHWRAAVEAAGVDPRAVFHDLKKFYTRTLVKSGDHDPKTVQRLSRHDRFEVTWDIYAESGEGMEEVHISAFSKAFTPKGDDSSRATG